MKRPYIPQGIDQQGRITPTMERNRADLDARHDALMWGRPGFTAAEACSELGAEPTGRPRMGLMHGWERTAIGFSKRPWGLFWVAVCAAVVGYFVKVM